LPYPHRTSCVITVGPAIFGNYVTSSNAYWFSARKPKFP
jgi:hypothetical protein